MTSLRKLVIGLGVSFGAPWLLLVVIPALKAQKTVPIPYDKDRDGLTGFYPADGVYRQGQLVYLKEGCVQCHTQVIRTTFNNISDGWKKGWGSDQSDVPKHVVRASTMRDYLGEPVAPLGVQRNGPDLANFGYRVVGEAGHAALHVKLYAPRSQNEWSIMPSYRHLYKVQKIQGAGSPDALKLPKDLAPKKGYEVVPTAEAVELVNYLSSLKKDAPEPGKVVADSK
ncbi:cbb3-type cytochrome c oxidase subunit II [Verrucomicrobium sp. BvORR034]|jgi:cytochrome c oxidase cbb3-type subunit 2|uniref:cbb3-type cytochrome c oxidase subunit II n=1 Tax=Verrucomicrobium sp. BvORR034 TaxID=1396418 RepID=UPI00067842A7|nr:cbb3-type cytochrome c oxidase subunit II [Verrucomicrobium sp. BvORR034]